MKKTLRIIFFLTLIISGFSNTISAVNSPKKENDKKSQLQNQLSADDLLNKDRREIEHKLGKKLNLKERIVLKLLKKKIKKAYKKGKSKEELRKVAAYDKFEFHLGAFFLGLILGLILSWVGAIIVSQYMKKEKRKSAWIGFAVGALIYTITLIILLKAFFSAFTISLFGG